MPLRRFARTYRSKLANPGLSLDFPSQGLRAKGYKGKSTMTFHNLFDHKSSEALDFGRVSSTYVVHASRNFEMIRVGKKEATGSSKKYRYFCIFSGMQPQVGLARCRSRWCVRPLCQRPHYCWF